MRFSDRLIVGDPAGAVPIVLVTREEYEARAQALPPISRAYLSAIGFEPKPGAFALLPGERGEIAAALLVTAPEAWDARELHAAGRLATVLPAGRYRLDAPPHDLAGRRSLLLSWLLSAYSFDRYRPSASSEAVLIVDDRGEVERAQLLAQAIAFGRDLINTPANDMGPQALEDAASECARTFGAQMSTTRGRQLLEQNFPLIHAVGRAGVEEPRLVDMQWGEPTAPKVVLVGKGVCFDTGGLDIKPGKAMSLMKKDMAGAATALSLFRMIAGVGLRIRLRVILPIVENSISSSAFRPGDVYRSRKGLTVEIGDTDAEGRLILADALAFAEEDAPDLLLDFATLTGAARTALGPDLPPFYTRSEALAADIERASLAASDPVWRMPLWRPYGAMLESRTADTGNVSATPFAGSVVAALFLSRFVDERRDWAHFDIYGWNPSSKPGRPEGGEIQTARLLFDLMERRWSG